METVVEEKPLAFATSRIVTILVFTMPSGFGLNFTPSLADTTVDSNHCQAIASDALRPPSLPN
jgi:hypothetical protein